jgi:tetratricopeptide (TPR) repeat protein
MMQHRTCLVASFLAALVFLPAAGGAESVDSLFDEANEVFWNGQYEEAIEIYRQLEDLGVESAALSYNRGTAEARLGNLGRAVRHYERVLRIEPGHEDARHNLKLVREFIARRASEAGRDAELAPAVGPWRAVLDRFSSRSAALGLLGFHLLLFAVLIVRRFVLSETPRLTLGVLAGVLAVLTLAGGALAIGKYIQEADTTEAVVIRRGTLEVMEGPDSEVERFAIEEGSRVTLLEHNDGWARLRDGQGRDGWAPAEALGEI